MKPRDLVIMSVLAYLILPGSTWARPWTAVATTGAIDESALSYYAVGVNPTALKYLNGSTSTSEIVARYNVTSTDQFEFEPFWGTLELGYFDSWPGASVSATFYKVDPCTGLRTALCTVTSTDSASATCRTCTFSHNVAFESFVYYVEVTIQRSSTTEKPEAYALRIY